MMTRTLILALVILAPRAGSDHSRPSGPLRSRSSDRDAMKADARSRLPSRDAVVWASSQVTLITGFLARERVAMAMCKPNDPTSS